ncbi:MAG: hypothetical protein E6G10_09250 [Actinobacteria bacterium]|nr:MAG: hypothetical protein E6G10_09250 [Actinomycetota bacterium]
MSRTIGRRLIPSPSMVVAFTALAVSIGGTSYAVVRLPAKSVGTVNLKSGAVGRANIKNNAVDGSKVQNHSLTSDDLDESALTDLKAAGVDKIFYKTGGTTLPPAAGIDSPSIGASSAVCDPGTKAMAGGARLDAPEQGELIASFPDAGGSVWTVYVANGDLASAHSFTVYAVCVPINSTG